MVGISLQSNHHKLREGSHESATMTLLSWDTVRSGGLCAQPSQQVPSFPDPCMRLERYFTRVETLAYHTYEFFIVERGPRDGRSEAGVAFGGRHSLQQHKRASEQRNRLDIRANYNARGCSFTEFYSGRKKLGPLKKGNSLSDYYERSSTIPLIIRFWHPLRDRASAKIE